MKQSGLLVLSALIACLAGCKKKTSPFQRPAYAQELNEAKLHDVSLPVGVTAYDMTVASEADDMSQEKGSETIAFYETNFSETMLREFYQMDMERLGWREVQTFISADESLLLYETPRKIAAISIRPYHNNRGVVIFVGQRQVS
jgi:hypothetical protein